MKKPRTEWTPQKNEVLLRRFRNQKPGETKRVICEELAKVYQTTPRAILNQITRLQANDNAAELRRDLINIVAERDIFQRQLTEANAQIEHFKTLSVNLKAQVLRINAERDHERQARKKYKRISNFFNIYKSV